MVASGGPSSAMQQLVRLGGASMVVECSSHDTEKLLHLAAVNEDPTMARYMLELVLHLAAAQGWLATVEWLMEIGADIFSHDNQGRTPLHTAAASMGIDSTTVVRFSVDRGLEVEDADEGGMTPLHHVLYSYDVLHKDAFDPEVSLANARYLLQRGANVNAKDLEGTTPLHLATWRGNSAVVKLLLKSGADVEARNRGDVKPIDHANKKTRFGSFSNWQQESDLVIVLSSDEYGPHIQYCNYRVF
ncbi:uncharacterized protein VDAG_02772 [Verticillium dahliae VdLs.17]|uniref:Uncharacterized protein n=1 Tax=Verticillium dahliae (strain VdLs.17 / ATCC MYA-4575 / FGSC 10137) TaxID=498257 RepID=G2WWZ3_VERDV|nr:uncharacterized protein VDAG_02772 [Verticillium dahliae VdLs.17]EGY21248.1 hypothetical protein VDAG_02772 [Verticillium dahliae VdLs.17]KAH6707234.1 ankyrin repeat-containing domain protein [Verticillium dahliae]